MAITSIHLSNLNGNNGFRMDGTAVFNFSGSSVSNAGDVNGDGFDDVIIGASRADPNDENSGSSYVVFGQAVGFSAAMNLSSLDGSNGFRLDGKTHEQSGLMVSNAGDVNGDGNDDLIIGAPGAAANGLESGSSYVVFGQAAGFSAAMDLSSLNGSNGFRLDGVKAYDLFGGSVSNAGDINGDGFDDVIIGALFASPNGNYNAGSSYVVFGKANGFEAALDISSLDGSNGFRLDGVAVSDYSGSLVSDAGDVNGDGFDDVIIGASRADPNDENSGSSYVVFGQAAGFKAALDLSNLNGSNGFRLDGVETGFFLTPVSNAGDINGDGFDDVIVGAEGATSNGYHTGASYVVFGKALGFDAAISLSSLDGNNGFRLDGAAPYDESGSSVSSAGDVNGDGFDDLIIGAPNAASNGNNSSGTGSSYVVFGQASGFEAAMDLASLDGKNGFRLDGVVGSDAFGASVSGAGDVNGDGFDDLIVGAPQADPNGYSSGSSYIIFGRSDFSYPDVTHPGTPGNDNLIGTSAADIFDAGDGNDNLIGRGGADVFGAGAGDDNIRVSDLNFQLVEGGAGNDALHLTGKDLNLDLNSLGGNIIGIETICLYGNGDNAVTLTAAGLINLSDSTNTLKVNGNAGDHIIGLSSGWADEGARGDGYFHAYTQGDAVLLVGANVTTDFPLV
ncbi:MAG: FG-GAP repeat protein [Nitrosomonas sp.]|nr:FG-GAP repeat protein [Nitrosomonas sp.]MBP6074834.1 FG-GAP repeat protein [Nitrosomonas sp.]